MLVIVFRSSDQSVPVPNQDHNTLHAIFNQPTSSINLILHAPLCIRSGILLLELSSQRIVRRRGCSSPTHGAVCLEIKRGDIVGIEVVDVHVKECVLDAICGRNIGPLRHARGTEEMVALCTDGREEEKLADLLEIR